VRIPVIANGEIWTVADAAQCRIESGCHGLMIGRGMVCDPGLALAISRPGHAPLAWADLLPLLAEFWALIKTHIEPKARAGRLKQWLNFLRRRYPQAEDAYAAVRTLHDPLLVAQTLFTKQA
jgi:tRNA-dihydrouridine synthase C